MNIWWITGFAVAALVVVIVAVLLLGILYQARRIRKLALTAVGVVSEIDVNTRSVWSLRTTNSTAAAILGVAQEMKSDTGAIRAAVAGHHDEEHAA